MEDTQKPILVPWDFSEIAEYALAHAVQLAKIIKCPIVLAHVTKKASENEPAKEKLAAAAKELEKKFGILPGFVVKEGSIFTAITEMADETDAIMAIMGTHGMKGMQKITGSWALKVITGSKCPFVVVQEPPHDHGFKNIIFPVDFKSEDKEKLVWANYLSKFYSTKIHLTQIKSNDPLVKKRTAANFNLAVKYLSEKGIDYEMKTLEGKGSLATESLNYAKEIDAGLILIMTTKNIRFQDYVLGASEQQLIANDAKIPVMCVNPRMDLRKFGGFS
jgi:nucleotide-binding universal stress UspA family protein